MKNTERRSESALPSQAIQSKKKEINSLELLSLKKRKFKRGDPHPLKQGLFFWGLTYKYKVNGERSINQSWVDSEGLARRRQMMMDRILVWQKNNPQVVKACNRAIKLKNKTKNRIHLINWKKNNADRWRKTKAAWHRKKLKECPIYRLRLSVRSRVTQFLNTRNLKKIISIEKIVGCSPQFLKRHIESQFKPGMTWDRRSEFHIDHKIPLSSGHTRKQILSLCHYKNLQPLWKHENLLKGAKIST